MINYDKAEIRKQLDLDMIYELLEEWGGDPEYTEFGIVSATICHNPPGIGSRKLYYYTNTGLFHCYSGCAEPSFDPFQLVIKLFKIQRSIEFDLNDAVRYVAIKFGIQADYIDIDEAYKADYWEILNNYDKVNSIELKDYHIELKEYEEDILNKFNYNIKITPWLKEGINQEVLEHNKIGYFLGTDQITIPHYDINSRFIGLRGRTVVKDDAERFGKYRPMRVNGILYSHPLGMNLYNINNATHQISKIKKAIIFEGEKSTLLYQSYFGIDNDISVACCGSSISAYQVQELLDLGVEEIIVAFDRQFQQRNDEEFKHLTNNLTKINERYKNNVLISFIFDKEMITGYKSSPIDEGKEKFLYLFKNRIIL